MDWDQDGSLDILSGCYWTEGTDAGQIQILKGNGSLDFKEAVALENAAGQPLENLSLADDPSQQTSTICTQQHAVDYDGDGDLDLVVGCFGPKFFLYENKADKKNGEASLSENPVELSIESPNHHSAPHLVDWDADGDLDLLSGSGKGGVIYSENTGSREKPVWSPFKQLVDSSSSYQQTTDGGSKLAISKSTRTWATDFNGDGLLDLLVGDSAMIVNAAEGVSAEEFNKLRAENDEAIAALAKQYEPVLKEYRMLLAEEKDGSEEFEEQMGKYREEHRLLSDARSKFEVSTSTGFVWLLIQKPKTKQVSIQSSESWQP